MYETEKNIVLDVHATSSNETVITATAVSDGGVSIAIDRFTGSGTTINAATNGHGSNAG